MWSPVIVPQQLFTPLSRRGLLCHGHPEVTEAENVLLVVVVVVVNAYLIALL